MGVFVIETVKIPANRIAVLVGKTGSVRREIEKKLKVKLTIDEEVSIDGDALNVMDAKNIVTAIGRGFSPQNAMKLTDEENTIAVIYLPSDERKMKRLKSRIIGEGGRARENLERLTDTNISIFGKTVSIIGPVESVKDMTDVMEMFIKGFSHRAIYAFLEKQRTKRKSFNLGE